MLADLTEEQEEEHGVEVAETDPVGSGGGGVERGEEGGEEV